MAEPENRPSRARWIVPLAILFVFLAFVAGLFLLFVAAVSTTDTLRAGTILQIHLAGDLREAPEPMALLLPGISGPPSLIELRKALNRAAGDENIGGVEIEIENLSTGWGKAEELLAAMGRFRASGKPLHVYLRGDMISDLDYAVALGADKIWVAPTSTLMVNGLRAEVEFWRGTLDKLHIEPQYFMMKEYKSAGEPLSRYEMSPAFREATQAVLEDIIARFTALAAERRKLEPAALRTLLDRGLLTTADGLEAGWIDAVGYQDEIRSELRRLAHADSWRSISVRRYLERTASQDLLSHGTKVALVVATGPVVASSGESLFGDDNLSGPRVARAIVDAADDDDIRAILFRVDSPGGSVVGSDHVRRAVEYARKQKKPVVVSMSSVAGSGGYWVAMGADAIVAHPTTITGSIGVVFGKINVKGLYQMVGANVETVDVGKNADLLSLVSSLDAEQTAQVETWMTAIYTEFVRRVAEGRKLDPAQVEEVARGRIWSGSAALDRKLIDRLGGYDEALAVVREKLELGKDAPIDLAIYPGPRTIFDILFASDTGTELRSLLRPVDPATRLELTLRELARPGAWLLTPDLRID